MPLLLLFVLLWCQPGQALAGCACPSAARTIAVSGSGEVMLAATVGEAYLQVETQAASAAKALGQTAGAAGRVMEALKTRLAAGDELSTEGYELFPVHEYPERGKTRLAGYRAVARLRLKVLGPKRLGELLDLAVASGATGLSGVAFTNPGVAEAQREAAALALREARALAERLAAEAKVTLGPLVSLSTQTSEPPRPWRQRVALAAAEAAPPIEPGALGVRSEVQAVYALEEKGR